MALVLVSMSEYSSSARMMGLLRNTMHCSDVCRLEEMLCLRST